MSYLLRLFCPLARDSVVKLSQFRQLGSIAGSVRTTKSKRLTKPVLKGKFSAITLTDAAVQRVQYLLSQETNAVGLRIGVRARGCNGLSYTLAFCVKGEDENSGKGCEVVEQEGIKIFIDRRAQLTLLGSEMDFQTNPISSEFVFNNPNVTGTCGCGESFTV